MERADDFAERRKHLADLDDDALKARFWSLAREIVSPIIDLAKTHTSPSIERSVLLRMGFSSLEAKEIVNHCVAHGLLGKGAGHAVLKLGELENLPYREAGLKLSRGEGFATLKGVWS